MRVDRGRVHVVDVIVLTAAFLALVYLAPVINSMVADAGFDPFTGMLLELLVPFLFLLVLLGIGTSGRRST